jgi:hypothetical protein
MATRMSEAFEFHGTGLNVDAGVIPHADILERPELVALAPAGRDVYSLAIFV